MEHTKSNGQRRGLGEIDTVEQYGASAARSCLAVTRRCIDILTIEQTGSIGHIEMLCFYELRDER